ncbi:MAG: hypothetical protein DRH20_02595 [Deltaproteobacteria bacterium]|nr:MAG: hypothetical protein DRH20_02595 [Deltaproteobacteria bacterium]
MSGEELYGRPWIPPVDFERIELAAYRLLSIFFADKEIQERKGKGEITFSCRETLKEAQIIHLLREVAVLYRAYDESFLEANEFRPLRDERIVGNLYELADSSRKLPGESLKMREGCNKIIHAQRVSFEYGKLRNSDRCYLHPVVHLFGRKKKEWEAKLQVIEFCEFACTPLHVIAMAKSPPIQI